MQREIDAGADVNATDDHNVTPLHFAAQHAAIGAARLLINAGADVNARNNFGNTPLWVALLAPRGNPAHPPLLQLLIDRGANPSITNTSGKYVLDILGIIASSEKTEAIENATAAPERRG